MTITELQNMIAEFHQKMRLPDHIDLSDSEYLMFRNGLLLEEISELFMAIYRGDEIGIADGLADIMYVVVGTSILLNLPLEELMEEVHHSNMTKTVGAIKGEDYVPPNIQRVLEENC